MEEDEYITSFISDFFIFLIPSEFNKQTSHCKKNTFIKNFNNVSRFINKWPCIANILKTAQVQAYNTYDLINSIVSQTDENIAVYKSS